MPELDIVPMQQCAQLEVLSAKVGKYTISRLPLHMNDPDDWMCTCSSFKFRKGLDDRGYCKHIRQYMAERCTWHEIYGAAQTEEQRANNICPECGGPTEWRSVGV